MSWQLWAILNLGTGAGFLLSVVPAAAHLRHWDKANIGLLLAYLGTWLYMVWSLN